MHLISLKVAGAIVLSLCAASFACGSDVQDADKFALGGIGVAGTISKGESTLRTILDAPDAVTQLEKMLPHARTLVGCTSLSVCACAIGRPTNEPSNRMLSTTALLRPCAAV